MREIDAHFGHYEHLRGQPREAEALHTLKKLASVVKPIMRKRGWRVGTLCEFLPPEPNLLGLNVNGGERILVRLRYPGDPRQFMPFESTVDTLLHELAHIVWGPHDHNFQRLWDELRSEHLSLLSKGYTGEGFLSKGHKLGGRHVPLDELRRQARVAAEKRQVLSKGSGQKLGGRPVQRDADMRQVIADAAQRRNTITKGCSTGTKEADRLAEQARRNGFRTKAEEDDANNAAIANALIELMEEEEAAKLNGTYKPSASEGLSWTRENGLELAQSKPPSLSKPPASPSQKPTPAATNRNGRPISRLVAEDEARKNPGSSSRTSTYSTSSYTPNAQAPPSSKIWACPVCTLENPLTSLYCDACETEKPSASPFAPPSSAAGGFNLNQRAPQSTSTAPREWTCRQCGWFMESQWWTCSNCGTMKASS